MNLQMLLGRVAQADYYDYDTWEVFVCRGDLLTQALLDHLDAQDLGQVEAALQGVTLVEKRYQGWGSYKSARARATLREGSGVLRVNGVPSSQYFREAMPRNRKFLRNLLNMVEVSDWLSQVDIVVQVIGSSPTTKRQVNAVAHAVANVLIEFEPPLALRLTQAGYGKGRSHGQFED